MLDGLQKAGAGVGSSGDSAQLELLAHYETTDDGSESCRSGFAVVLELTERRLLVEGDVTLTAGQELKISFFLPSRDGGRTNVGLDCVVAQCRDAGRLHYSCRVSKISEASRRAISNFQPAEDSR